MINIKYIVNVRLPTSRAQGYAIMKMSEEFAKAGANVELIVPTRKNNDTSEEDPYKYYNIQPIFNIIKIRSLDLLGSSIKFGRLFYWLDIFSFLISILIKKILKPNDILYTRDFIIPLLFSKKDFICLELHDIPKSKFLFRLAIKKPRLFFVLNQNIKDVLVDFGIPESKIYISPSGVDIDKFNIDLSKEDARNKIGLPLDKKIVMYTGHLYKWKGIDTIADIGKEMKEILFIFVGGDYPELDYFKESYKDYENIKFYPFQQRDIIPIYLKASDVLVLPYSDKEDISSKYTSPLKLFEYMASGRPIVTSDLSSIRKILDENNALFARSGNKEDFKFNIEKAITDTALADKLTKASFNKVIVYSWDKRANNILSIIKSYDE